jgi:hypothetical protein
MSTANLAGNGLEVAFNLMESNLSCGFDFRRVADLRDELSCLLTRIYSNSRAKAVSCWLDSISSSDCST